MRMIYEHDIEKEDFIEIMLTDKDITYLTEDGVSKQFINPFTGRILNVYLRIDNLDTNQYEIFEIKEE